MRQYLVVVIWKDGRENRMRVPGNDYADAASRCPWLTELSEHVLKAELIEISGEEKVIGVNTGNRVACAAAL